MCWLILMSAQTWTVVLLLLFTDYKCQDEGNMGASK